MRRSPREFQLQKYESQSSRQKLEVGGVMVAVGITLTVRLGVVPAELEQEQRQQQRCQRWQQGQQWSVGSGECMDDGAIIEVIENDDDADQMILLVGVSRGVVLAVLAVTAVVRWAPVVVRDISESNFCKCACVRGEDKPQTQVHVCIDTSRQLQRIHSFTHMKRMTVVRWPESCG